MPSIPEPPTHDEDLSTKPACQQSSVDEWKTIALPQPWIELHRKFHYQMQHTVDDQITRVLDAPAMHAKWTFRPATPTSSQR